MARPLRPAYQDATYHVTSRGNRKSEIYCDAADRSYFLQVVARVVERHGWLLHAYCLMTNHYHLVVTTPAADISAGMQRLNSLYATWVNWRYGLTGHLFEGRFASKLVQTDAHFLQACRYVVLNPVRAGLCDTAGEYRWSSYRATAGSARRPDFLRTERIMATLGVADPATAPALYRAFVDAGTEEAIRLRAPRVEPLTSALAA